MAPDDLRAAAGFAVNGARPALAIFEDKFPGDGRPRAAVDAAHAFTQDSDRTEALRDRAWDAQRATQQARDAGQAAASEAVRAALTAAGALGTLAPGEVRADTFAVRLDGLG